MYTVKLELLKIVEKLYHTMFLERTIAYFALSRSTTELKKLQIPDYTSWSCSRNNAMMKILSIALTAL
jgi:hypothetical protein